MGVHVVMYGVTPLTNAQAEYHGGIFQQSGESTRVGVHVVTKVGVHVVCKRIFQQSGESTRVGVHVV